MLSEELQRDIRQATQIIRSARHICCLTGAGISAESGIPTFRGDGGLWNGKRPEELATPEAFNQNPQEVWAFYLARRRKLKTVKPNPGHHALVTIEQNANKFTLITQNVDGLHATAGSQNVICLHGDILIDRCTHCHHQRRVKLDPDEHKNTNSDKIPHCPLCNAIMRPGVVWFGESLPPEAIQSAHSAATDCDVMLVVGTSAVVQPAASFATWAKSNHATLIEINPESTPLTHETDLHIPLKSAQALSKIATPQA